MQQHLITICSFLAGLDREVDNVEEDNYECDPTQHSDYYVVHIHGVLSHWGVVLFCTGFGYFYSLHMGACHIDRYILRLHGLRLYTNPICVLLAWSLLAHRVGSIITVVVVHVATHDVNLSAVLFLPIAVNVARLALPPMFCYVR